MQKYIYTLILGFLALIVPVQIVYAEEILTPDPVTDIQARWEENAIVLSWKKVSFSGGIQGYKIYYSSESILQNEGSYEDVQEVLSDTGSYIFGKAPLPSKEIYFTMFAVGKNGQESPGFVVESKILNNLAIVKDKTATIASDTTTSAQTTNEILPQSSSVSSSSSLSSSQDSSIATRSGSIVSEVPYIRNPILEASIVATEETISEQIQEKIPLANSGMQTTIIGSIALMMSGWYVMKKYRTVH